VDPVLFPIALAGFLAAIFRLRFFWQDTLFVTAFLWEAGYAAFIVFHYDGPPRYFVTLIVPTLWLALVFLEWLWRERRPVGMALAACVLASVAWNIASIVAYLAHPRYTLVDASMEIKRVIEADPQSSKFQSNKLMIGRGADEISLLSGGFPTMDSDGAMPLSDKIEAYQPGWFMQWTFDAPLRTVTVSLRRQMEQRARFAVLGPTGQANLTLYHLLPKR
jgi:hypothetical protein